MSARRQKPEEMYLDRFPAEYTGMFESWTGGIISAEEAEIDFYDNLPVKNGRWIEWNGDVSVLFDADAANRPGLARLRKRYGVQRFSRPDFAAMAEEYARTGFWPGLDDERGMDVDYNEVTL